MSVASSTLDLTVRPLQPGDYDAWRTLWSGYLSFYEAQVSEDVARTSFARMLSGRPGEFAGRLAVLRDRPVGLVHFLFHRHGWKTENVCYLQDLYADPDWRGRGIGRALIAQVYAEADAAGAPSVYWMTQDFNHRARRLYDTLAVQTPFIKYARAV